MSGDTSRVGDAATEASHEMVASAFESNGPSFGETAGGTVGVFLDWDNLHYRYFNLVKQTHPDARLAATVPDVGAILGVAQRFGRITVGAAYADWCKPELRPALTRLLRHGIEPVVVPGWDAAANAPVKNAADVGLAVAAVETLYCYPHLDTFLLGSGDGSLLSLVTLLHRHARQVVVLSVGNALSDRLADAADAVIRYEEAIAPPPSQAILSFAPDAAPLDVVFAWTTAILREQGGRCLIQHLGHELKRRHGLSAREWYRRPLSELLHLAVAEGLVVVSREGNNDVVALAALDDPVAGLAAAA